MKHLKKLASLLLAFILSFGMGITAMADDSGSNTEARTGSGSITIAKAVEDKTYTIYEILKLESFDEANKRYSYVPASDEWKAFLESPGIIDEYVSINKAGYVTGLEKLDSDTATFADLALTYAKSKDLKNQGVVTAAKGTDGTVTAKFENIELGYYLVDSSLGTICSLDTTNENVNIEEKNGVPENTKLVQEDFDEKWYDHNDADIGQTVNFKSTITAQAGAQKYVFHDKMSAGLTFTGITDIKIGQRVLEENNDYTVTVSTEENPLAEGYTFEVHFEQTFCNTLTKDDKIVISYTAVLNKNAVIAGEGNSNECYLSYGDDSQTTISKTITYTWDFEVLKFANNNKTNVLQGVKFVLLNSDKSKAVSVINGKVTGWNKISGDNYGENSILETGADGKISIKGLDSDTYYLREIETLAGYNKLPGDVEVTISRPEFDGTGKCVDYKTAVAEVENKSGTELPSTGGMGTTLFYLIGGVLVIVAGVLLVTNRRMSNKN